MGGGNLSPPQHRNIPGRFCFELATAAGAVAQPVHLRERAPRSNNFHPLRAEACQE
ncbi:MAG: hypothetical protein KatS3mg004_3377 [Bryobacteraceae bacterium]|nr:MAG: hypothetical protein KatS3mg004_3377 [Bryobacteraceae bacterium]